MRCIYSTKYGLEVFVNEFMKAIYLIYVSTLILKRFFTIYFFLFISYMDYNKIDTTESGLTPSNEVQSNITGVHI